MTSQPAATASAVNVSADVLERLLHDGIKAHWEEIARIWAAERFPVVVFELHPSCADIAASFGWDGACPVFAMPLGARIAIVAALRGTEENPAVQTLADAFLTPAQYAADGLRPTALYLLALVGKGLALIRCDERGYTIELGTVTGDESS